MKKLFARALALLLASAMLTAGFAGCGGGTSEPDTSNDTPKSESSASTPEPSGTGDTTSPDGEKLAAEQVFNGLQPSLAVWDVNAVSDSESGAILGAIYEGLFRLNTNPDGTSELENAGCESYDISEDGKVYTFHLRDNKWNDGQPVTAQHYADSIFRLLNPENAFAYAFFGFSIQGAEEYYTGNGSADQIGVKVIDDKTLEITLKEAEPYFLTKLSYTVFLPIRLDIIEQQGDNYGSDYTQIPYNGPFYVSEWTNEQYGTMLKNPNYWDAANVKLERINLNKIVEFATQAQLFEAGQLDHTGSTLEYLEKWREEAKNGKFQHMTRTSSAFAYWGFKADGGKSGLMSNAKIRKAIGYSLDKDEYLKTLYGRFVPAYGIVPTPINCGEDGFRNQVEEPIHAEAQEYLNNPEKLQALFHEGLKELGKDVDDLGTITLSYLTYGESTRDKQVQEYFQQTLKKNLGINLEMRIEGDFGLFMKAAEGNDYDFAQFNWSADYNDPMTFLDLFRTGGGSNYAGYSNPKYDEMLDSLAGEQDTAKRLQTYAELEKLITFEDAGVIPLYYSDINTFVQNKVRGFQLPAFGGTYEYKYAYIVED